MKNRIIYISYADADFEHAKKLYDLLAKVKSDFFTPWYRKDLPIGNIDGQIEEKIKNSTFAIILLSRESIMMTDKFFSDENEFIEKHHPNFFPIKVDSCETPNRLKNFNILNFFPNLYDSSFKKLLNEIGIESSHTDYFTELGEPITNLTEAAKDSFIEFTTSPSEPKDVLDLAVYYGAGIHAFYKGDYLSALQRILKAERFDFYDKNMYSKMGACYIKLGDIEKAIQILNKGIALETEKIASKKSSSTQNSKKDPRHSTNYYNLGIAYKKKYNELIADCNRNDSHDTNAVKLAELRFKTNQAFTETLAIKQNHVNAINNLAVFFNEQNKKEDAIKLLQEKVGIPVENPAHHHLTHYNLACYLTDKEEALSHLEKAIELDKSNLHYAISDEELDPLKTSLITEKNFWHILLEKAPAYSLPVQKHLPFWVRKSDEEKNFYEMAKLLIASNNIQGAFYCLNLACMLNPDIVQKAITEEEFSLLKTGENSIIFWNIISGQLTKQLKNGSHKI